MIPTEIPPAPAESPQELIARANVAEYEAEMALREAMLAAPPGVVEVYALPMADAWTLALADDDALTAAAARDAGLAAWAAHHDGAREREVAPFRALHQAQLREVYQDRPEVLAVLGIDPEPAVLVGYPQAQAEG